MRLQLKMPRQIKSASADNIDLVPGTTADINLGGNSSGPCDLRFLEDSDNGTNYVALKAASAITTTVTYILPEAPAASGYVLQSTTGGTLSWSSEALQAPNGIKGTVTNDSAAASNVGEIISSVILVGSAVSMTTATPANITSVSLTAGDWDVWGSIWTSLNAATVSSRLFGSISQTTGTLATTPGLGTSLSQITTVATAGDNVVLGIPATRISLAETTTVYLVGQINFSINTAALYGNIIARRRR